MRLEFHTLDVFTDQRFGGNSLAVVLAADALDTPVMQSIAREFNLSETVFVLKAENPAHSARLRIFTPLAELPFAGHPTVGTAVLLAGLRAPAGEYERDAIVVLEQGIGRVRVGVRLRAAEAPFAEFDAPRLPQPLADPSTVERIAAALGLLPTEIGFENHRPSAFSSGNSCIFVPVSSLEAISKAEIVAGHWGEAFPKGSAMGAFLYCRQTVHAGAAFHARMFAPDVGVPEDPATGSAVVGLAGVVHRFDDLPDGHHKRVVEQGLEMGRPSRIVLSMDIEAGKLHGVRIGGHAVRVASGHLEV